MLKALFFDHIIIDHMLEVSCVKRWLSTSSCIFASLIEALAAFGLDYHFKDVCIVNSFRRATSSPPELKFSYRQERHITPSGAKDMHIYCPL